MTLDAVAAAAHTKATLVATRHGTRLHLIVQTARTFTSFALVRRGCFPVCRHFGRRWRAIAPDDSRALCAHCTAWAIAVAPVLTTPEMYATPAEVHARLLEVTDPDELHRLVLAICTRRDLIRHVVADPVYGGRRRLTAYVPAARDRCSTSPNRRNA